VALSTAEAEYMAMSGALQEAAWLRQLLHDLQCTVKKPVELFTDNQAAVSIAGSTLLPNSRSKHSDVRHHFVREQVRSGRVTVKWVPSNEQLADMFTKPLAKQTFTTLAHAVMTGQQQQVKSGDRHVKSSE
jgi:hypothetical protein